METDKELGSIVEETKKVEEEITKEVIAPPVPQLNADDMIDNLGVKLDYIARKWKKKRHLTIEMFEETLQIGMMYRSFMEFLKQKSEEEREKVNEISVAGENTEQPIQDTPKPTE
jgi:hypothetical protein